MSHVHMYQKRIIAFCGKAASGKSTAALLATDLLPDAKIVSFARPLKDAAHLIWGWAGIQNAEYYEKLPSHKNVRNRTIGLTPRQLWIALGTDFARKCIHADTWCNALFHHYSDGRGALVIPDCRFKNEAEGVKQRGGMLIWIERNVPKVSDVCEITPVMCDAVIDNNHTLVELRDNLERILK